MESALDIGDDPASPLAALFDAVIWPIQRPKGETEAVLWVADLEHTTPRPGVDRRPRTDTAQVAPPDATLWGAVSRADVARLVAAAPWIPTATDRTFEVVDDPFFRGRSDLVAVDWIDRPLE